MLEIKKHNLVAWMAVIFISIVAAMLGMIYSETTEQFIMSLLPLAYMVAVTLSGAFLTFIDSSSPGFMIVNILYFVKCVIYPVVNVISGTTYTSSDTLYAILLEIGEIFVIYFVFFLYTKFGSSFRRNTCSEYSSIQNHLVDDRFVILIFLLLVLAICIFLPQALNGYNFFTVESLEIIYEGISEEDTSGAIALIIKISRYVLTAYLLGFCYRKYQQTGNASYIVLAVFVVGATMMIVRGVSRSDFVIPGACGYFLLLRMFPRQTKIISFSLLGCLAVVFITFSVMRFGATDSLEDLSKTLQAYFSCEKNMATAIAARREYGNEIGIRTLLSDLCGNWAGVGELFRDHYNISEYFNFAYYGHTYSVDQIVPTIGQAYMQYGSFGTYAYTVFMVIACLTLDKKYRQNDKIEFSYMYLYGTVKCSVTLMGNLKIFSATVFNILLPMLLLFWLNARLTIREKR